MPGCCRRAEGLHIPAVGVNDPSTPPWASPCDNSRRQYSADISISDTHLHLAHRCVMTIVAGYPACTTAPARPWRFTNLHRGGVWYEQGGLSRDVPALSSQRLGVMLPGSECRRPVSRRGLPDRGSLLPRGTSLERVSTLYARGVLP